MTLEILQTNSKLKVNIDISATNVHKNNVTCSTPPPGPSLLFRNSSGSPNIFPIQFIMVTSSSVHAGLAICKNEEEGQELYKYSVNARRWRSIIKQLIKMVYLPTGNDIHLLIGDTPTITYHNLKKNLFE